MGIPFEIITMLGSTLLSGFMSIWSQSIKARQAEQKMLIARAEVQIQAFKNAREYDNTKFQWTRRVIALTAVFSIILLPKLVAIFYPDIVVSVGYTQFKPGFLFVAEKEVLKWISFTGLVITPLDTNLVAAIVGMYFGGSLVKR
jgi:hypothetical protein